MTGVAEDACGQACKKNATGYDNGGKDAKGQGLPKSIFSKARPHWLIRARSPCNPKRSFEQPSHCVQQHRGRHSSGRLGSTLASAFQIGSLTSYRVRGRVLESSPGMHRHVDCGGGQRPEPHGGNKNQSEVKMDRARGPKLSRL